MEQSIILKGVYSETMNEDFNYGTFEKRLKLQKIVYLLQEMGLNVGGYSFSWYKHGPYSQSLQEDAYHSSLYIAQTIDFTDNAKDTISQFKDVVNEHTEKYNKSQWLETLASIRYLKKHYSFSDDEVLEELVSRKPHLNVEADNKRALTIINTVFAQ